MGSNQYCFGCLCSKEEKSIYCLNLVNSALKTVFQAECLFLCYLCKRASQQAELFIQNVQSNQILLENIHSIEDSTLHSVRSQSCAPHQLSIARLDTITLGAKNSQEEAFFVYDKGKLLVKREMKEEVGGLEDYDDGNVSDFQESFVKEEESFPLKALLKIEVEAEEVDLKSLKKSLKKGKYKRKKGKKDVEVKQEFEEQDTLEIETVHISREQCLEERGRMELDRRYLASTYKCTDCVKGFNYKESFDKHMERHREATGKNGSITDTLEIETVHISREQCLEERGRMELDRRYLASTYKCTDCVKGFNYKESFDKHMERHRETYGDYECDICKQRTQTEEKLISHKRYHELRYRCLVCGLTRISRLTIKDHYASFHSPNHHRHSCPHCSKSFKREVSWRKHISNVHRRERVTCAYCNKTYANKDVLKSHMIVRHPKEVSAVEATRAHVCQVCGKSFKAPSQLKMHSIKHSLSRDYYCVECDKSFKSASILKHHLKTASTHVSYVELPYECQYCDKRFAIRRDVERHTNRVHLNIKPHQCDRCEKAYVNAWSLNEHRRLTHEGFKRPLRFPCPMCDKVFDRNQILKGHIRTHTGERPYQCTHCPAQFSQASILGTHVKLIHLKLTRDGRPKALATK